MLLGSRLIGMAPLFESGQMQVQAPAFPVLLSPKQINYTPVAQLEEAAISKIVLCEFKSHQEYQPNF